VEGQLVPFASDLPASLAFARAAVLARAEPGVDLEQVIAIAEREIRSGRARGGLWVRAGRPLGLVLWDLSGPLGASVRLSYLRPEFASPDAYRELFDATARASGGVAFVPSLPGLAPEVESTTLRSLGFAPFSRSEMRFPPGATVPPLRAPPGIGLRTVRPEDEAELARVHAAAYREQFDRFLFLEDSDPVLDAEKVMHSLFHGRWGELLVAASTVAETGGRTVGGTVVLRTTGRSLIADVSVDPAHKGRGIGRALVTATVGALRERGEATIALAVTEENRRALRLYERIGFVRALGPTREWYNARLIPVPPGTD